MRSHRFIVRDIRLEDRITPAFGDFLQTIANPTQQLGGGFGTAVAADGDLVVVGAPINNAGVVLQSGTVHVYSATTGKVVCTLLNPDPDSHDDFGGSVAISGNRVVVGADSDAPGDVDRAGTAYVYDATSGALISTLNNPNRSDVDFFGNAVAISGNLAVVGAHWDDPADQGQAGRAYVFNTETGNLVATLNNPSPGVNDLFGTSVAISGTFAVVGAKWDSALNVFSPGAAYVYDATTGALVRALHNPSPQVFDEFGRSVAMSGNLAVVGAPGDDPGEVSDAGTAYVYDVSTGVLVTTLRNPTPASNDAFGITVAIAGNRAIVGSAVDAVGNSSTGTAYAFDATTGALLTTLSNPSPANFDQFGGAVAISGRRIVVGASGDDSRGAAHLFDAFIPLTLSNASVGEFRPTGTVVGTLSGPSGPYSLVSGSGATDNARFAIVGSNLVTARPLDVQTGASLGVRVRAANGVEQAFVVTVTDHPQATLSGRTLVLTSTSGDDSFGFTASVSEHFIVLNGVALAVRASDVDVVSFEGGVGTDTATLTARGAGNTAVMWPGYSFLSGAGYTAIAAVEQTTTYGGATDGAYLNDSSGNDVFVSGSTYGFVQGVGYRNAAVGFGGVSAYGSTGTDAAYLNDSSGGDVYVSGPGWAYLTGAGYWNTAVGFDGVTAYGGGGTDAAYLNGSAGSDVLVSGQSFAYLTGSGYWNTAVGFDGVTAYGGGGSDAAHLSDGPSNDAFTGLGSSASLFGPGFYVTANDFFGVHVYGTNGGVNRRVVGPVTYWLGFFGTWV